MARISVLVMGVALTCTVGAISILALQHNVDPTPSKPGPFAGTPTWIQDFSKVAGIDAKQWNIATPTLPIYNNEAQVYTDRASNIRIKDNTLILEAHREDFEGKRYTSARIDTKGHTSFTFGKIEITMKFPKGAGTWPAAWMLSSDQTYTKRLNPTEEDWAKPRFYMYDGELDIVETSGAHPNTIESTAHTYSKSHQKETILPGDPSGFHTYAILWTPTALAFTVDGILYHSLPKTSAKFQDWPFDQPMYLILNLAMGGLMGGEIDNHHDTWQLEIKKIAYYPYTGDQSIP